MIKKAKHNIVPSRHKKLKISVVILFSTLSFLSGLSCTAFAGGSDHMIMPAVSQAHRIEAFITGGIAIASLTNGNQAIVINSTTTNTYTTNKTTRANIIAGAGVSRLFHLKHNMTVTLGPAFYYTNFGDIEGTEHPYSNYGDFRTLNYQLSAQSFSLLLESRAIYSLHRIQPFIVAGVGASRNQLYGYSEVSTDPSTTATENPNVFQNNTQTDFAYEVGLGMQTQLYNDIKHHISYNADVSYRYFNFGSGQLKQSIAQTGNQTLKVNTLDAQTVLLSLSADFA